GDRPRPPRPLVRLRRWSRRGSAPPSASTTRPRTLRQRSAARPAPPLQRLDAALRSPGDPLPGAARPRAGLARRSAAYRPAGPGSRGGGGWPPWADGTRTPALGRVRALATARATLSTPGPRATDAMGECSDGRPEPDDVLVQGGGREQTPPRR